MNFFVEIFFCISLLPHHLFSVQLLMILFLKNVPKNEKRISELFSLTHLRRQLLAISWLHPIKNQAASNLAEIVQLVLFLLLRLTNTP